MVMKVGVPHRVLQSTRPLAPWDFCWFASNSLHCWQRLLASQGTQLQALWIQMKLCLCYASPRLNWLIQVHTLTHMGPQAQWQGQKVLELGRELSQVTLVIVPWECHGICFPGFYYLVLFISLDALVRILPIKPFWVNFNLSLVTQ